MDNLNSSGSLQNSPEAALAALEQGMAQDPHLEPALTATEMIALEHIGDTIFFQLPAPPSLEDLDYAAHLFTEIITTAIRTAARTNRSLGDVLWEAAIELPR